MLSAWLGSDTGLTRPWFKPAKFGGFSYLPKREMDALLIRGEGNAPMQTPTTIFTTDKKINVGFLVVCRLGL